MTTEAEKRPKSTAKAIADEEASRTEEELGQSEDEEPTPPEPAQAPDPAPEPEYPPEPTEEMFAAVRTLNGYHHEAVREVMGPFIEGFVECEGCGGSGLAYPEPPRRQLNKAPNEQECTVCGGWGELERPTKRQGFELEQCENCNGQGWVGPKNMPPAEAARQAVASFPAANGQEGAAPPPPPSVPPTTDPRVAQLRAEGYIIMEPPAR